MRKQGAKLWLVTLLLIVCLGACGINSQGNAHPNQSPPATSEAEVSITNLPEYSGKPYIAINGNTPVFTQEDLAEASFEHYSELDSLGRCGTVFACVSQDIMPTDERGSIGQIKPTGWQTVKYIKQEQLKPDETMKICCKFLQRW